MDFDDTLLEFDKMHLAWILKKKQWKNFEIPYPLNSSSIIES